ncbi:cytosine permease [Dehalococcoides mccartyi]|uniref:cytosine permease n=1 Tax=Dehalococcoides mccartyi TaxID=61435 RepID=UPI00122DF349|nr:cytosine permease [Dehalococcoides mccartyi]
MSYQPHPYFSYYPAGYQPQFWQALVAGVIDIAIMVALGAWALSLVKKALKGEEVELR